VIGGMERRLKLTCPVLRGIAGGGCAGAAGDTGSSFSDEDELGMRYAACGNWDTFRMP
jgi:hypothetical protein